MLRFVRCAEPRLDSIADVTRATRASCEHIGVTPPSDEQVRRLVHDARGLRLRRQAAVDLVLDLQLRARPPDDLVHLFEDPRDAPVGRRTRGT